MEDIPALDVNTTPAGALASKIAFAWADMAV